MTLLSDFLIATGGGVLIGLAATLMLGMNGRVAGVSGIVGGLLRTGADDRGWRLAFVAGLVGAGLVLFPVLPGAFISAERPAVLIIASGLLVGVGTRMANGCTSGHGVCGLARFSPRSLAAVGMFMFAGFFSATVAGLVMRGLP